MNLNFLFIWNTNGRKTSIFLASKLLGFDTEHFFQLMSYPEMYILPAIL